MSIQKGSFRLFTSALKLMNRHIKITVFHQKNASGAKTDYRCGQGAQRNNVDAVWPMCSVHPKLLVSSLTFLPLFTVLNGPFLQFKALVWVARRCRVRTGPKNALSY